jgi:putative Mg2+ transporter-C (MgtC) family protein
LKVEILITMNPAVWQISELELSIRIVGALVLGGLVGLERELGDHPAGFRTHILVCLGSTLIILLSIYGFSAFAYEANVRMDPARLAAQVVSGIGFLGAGTILRTGTTVSGLTTAASLWVVAAIGLAVGAGFYFGALLTTLLVVITLFLLNKFERAISRKRNNRVITIRVIDLHKNLQNISDQLEKYKIQVTKLLIEQQDVESTESSIRLSVKIRKPKKLQTAITEILNIKDVKSLETEENNLYDNGKKPLFNGINFDNKN